MLRCIFDGVVLPGVPNFPGYLVLVSVTSLGKFSSPGGSGGKNPPARETSVQSLGGRYSGGGHGKPTPAFLPESPMD